MLGDTAAGISGMEISEVGGAWQTSGGAMVAELIALDGEGIDGFKLALDCLNETLAFLVPMGLVGAREARCSTTRLEKLIRS